MLKNHSKEISIQPMACGAMAGASSRLVTSPIDLLKIRFQVKRLKSLLFVHRLNSLKMLESINHCGRRAS